MTQGPILQNFFQCKLRYLWENTEKDLYRVGPMCTVVKRSVCQVAKLKLVGWVLVVKSWTGDIGSTMDARLPTMTPYHNTFN
jgi:hypothetical protein